MAQRDQIEGNLVRICDIPILQRPDHQLHQFAFDRPQILFQRQFVLGPLQNTGKCGTDQMMLQAGPDQGIDRILQRPATHRFDSNLAVRQQTAPKAADQFRQNCLL